MKLEIQEQSNLYINILKKKKKKHEESNETSDFSKVKHNYVYL